MTRKCLLAIRIRGGVNASTRIEETLRMLRMDRNNTSTLLDDRPEYRGMLQKAKDYITWGEPTPETITVILEKRGKVNGGGSIDIKVLKTLGYSEIKDLATVIHSGSVEFHKLQGVKPFFRLHPPRKGFKRSVKRPYNSRGELGYRGEAINDLARRMV